MRSELKIGVEDPKKAEEKLLKLGAKFTDEAWSVDTYYNQPQGKVLKLVQAEPGASLVWLELKDGKFVIVKTDKIQNADRADAEYSKKFGKKCVLKKKRRLFEFKGFQLDIHSIDGLGSFLIVTGENPSERFVKEELGIRAPEFITDSFDNLAKAKEEEQWRQKLSLEQYHVCRLGGTEAPFSGKFVHNKENGTYICVACKGPLFSAGTKFESGTGWPSFYDVMGKGNVELRDDYSHFMHRIEVRCARCGSHLGHVFDDGPKPTGKRYCINSIALDFVPNKKN